MSVNNKWGLIQNNANEANFYRCYGRAKNYFLEGKTSIYHCPICLLPISTQSIKLHAAVHGKEFRNIFDVYTDIPQNYFKKYDPTVEITYSEYSKEIALINPPAVLDKLIADIRWSISKPASSIEPKFNKKSLEDIKVELPKEEEAIKYAEDQVAAIIDNTRDSLIQKLNKRTSELEKEKLNLLDSIETVKGYLKTKTDKLALLEEEMTIINDLFSVYREAEELCQKNSKKKS